MRGRGETSVVAFAALKDFRSVGFAETVCVGDALPEASGQVRRRAGDDLEHAVHLATDLHGEVLRAYVKAVEDRDSTGRDKVSFQFHLHGPAMRAARRYPFQAHFDHPAGDGVRASIEDVFRLSPLRGDRYRVATNA